MASKNNKGGKGASGGFMTSAKGLCSYRDNPVAPPRENKPMCGPGMNADQQKANRLLQRAQREVDSLRGKGVL